MRSAILAELQEYHDANLSLSLFHGVASASPQ